jgi:hypothetical protein
MTNRLTQKTRPIKVEQIGDKFKVSVEFKKDTFSTVTNKRHPVKVIQQGKCSGILTLQDAYEIIYDQIINDNQLR